MNNPFKYTCLFGGGAIRGIAYIGTIRALEELNIEYDIIGGSSVGSIIAALLAKGYKSYEIEKIFMKVNFNLFKDIHLGFGKTIGISKGELFLDWLNSLLSKNTDLKFEDLKKELVIITTNLTEFNCQEFSTSKTPDFYVSQAVKISSSMPGLIAPYKYETSYLVDGDLQKASPMWRLSETLKNSKSRILEFRLEGEYNQNDKNPISFINTIYSCVTGVATDFVTELYGKNDKYDCIRINTGKIFFADFNLSKDERRKLIELGYAQTMEYFKKYLPRKKENLVKIYSRILKYLKNAYKGLKLNNVEEVQWWFGDIFTLLCENKEIIDPDMYVDIINLKNNIMDSVGKFFFIYSHFKTTKSLKNEMQILICKFEDKIKELNFYNMNYPVV